MWESDHTKSLVWISLVRLTEDGCFVWAYYTVLFLLHREIYWEPGWFNTNSFGVFQFVSSKGSVFWYEESKIPVLLQALKQRISINMKILPRVSLVQITGKINPLWKKICWQKWNAPKLGNKCYKTVCAHQEIQRNSCTIII